MNAGDKRLGEDETYTAAHSKHSSGNHQTPATTNEVTDGTGNKRSEKVLPISVFSIDICAELTPADKMDTTSDWLLVGK